jgi:DNA-binding transcriptional LysR family regulator
MTMDVRRIRNFVAVVEAGSIARAAQSLHIAQPALSAQMRRMEELVGCQLLSRTSRGVTPTRAGVEFVRRAQEALRLLEALQAVGEDPGDDITGHVVIGAPASIGNMVAVPLLESAKRRYPAISLGLQESSSVYLGELLLRGRLDVAIVFGENHSPGIHSVPIAHEDLFLLGVETTGGKIDLQALEGVPLIMPARPNSVRSLLERACDAHGIAPHVIAEVSSPHTMVQLARAGIGAVVLPWSMVGAVSGPDLPVARIENPVLTRTIAVATAVDVLQSRALITIQSLLVEIVEDMIASGKWQGARLKEPPPAANPEKPHDPGRPSPPAR